MIAQLKEELNALSIKELIQTWRLIQFPNGFGDCLNRRVTGKRWIFVQDLKTKFFSICIWSLEYLVRGPETIGVAPCPNPGTNPQR
ncbi:hypothetical protein AVEN_9550-1 [Araneus ventricosus]|uniref:Uncharacterized protein n=1 Tax=Araneus ventricosus TaxID=182803 RepID=A0A4Y2QD63_ARAVE|nr:hypothetical protein AVEN_9550-1 [Araneus ventricosus]